MLIDSQARQLREAAADYRALVEQHLLWNPSTNPVDLKSPARLLSALPALTGVQGSSSIFEPVLDVLWQRALLVILVLLLVVALYAFKRGQFIFETKAGIAGGGPGSPPLPQAGLHDRG